MALPSRLLGYASPAEELILRFLDQKSRLEAGPRRQPLPSPNSLEDLHAAFKALDYPDQAAAYHWAVNEAMRHDIEALADIGQPDLHTQHRNQATHYWHRVGEEARGWAPV